MSGTPSPAGKVVGRVVLIVAVLVLVAVVGGYALLVRGMDQWAEAFSGRSERQQVQAPDPVEPEVAPGTGGDGAAEPVDPEATPLPDDAEETVRAVLQGLPWDPEPSAAAAAAVRALEAAFPDHVHARAEQEGSELAATVQAEGVTDCIVMVRPEQGEVFRFSDFDRILLMPGEYGCTPDLYLNPVTTH